MSAEHATLQYGYRTRDALYARDWSAYADAFAEDFRFEDRRAGLQSSLDKTGNLEQGRVMADLGLDRVDYDLIESRGKRLAMLRTTMQGAGFTVAMLMVVQVDDEGLGLITTLFDEDDIDTARAELERLAAGPD